MADMAPNLLGQRYARYEIWSQPGVSVHFALEREMQQSTSLQLDTSVGLGLNFDARSFSRSSCITPSIIPIEIEGVVGFLLQFTASSGIIRSE